jgi:hypothetical protein
MKMLLINFFILSIFTISCNRNYIKYELYSGGQKIFEIKPSDIYYYDTSQIRNGINIHELKLKEGYYKQDSFAMRSPLFLICRIGIKKYFKSELFSSGQSQPAYFINFNFKSIYGNHWSFPKQSPENLVLYTKNKCNSIEFFHMRDEYNSNRSGWERIKGFKNYTDTARFAHEILLDPYYINALKESGVKIK